MRYPRPGLYKPHARLKPDQRGHDYGVRAFASLVTAMCLVACGGEPSTQQEVAEEIASVAAEGSILARDLANGDSLGPFARTHARALEERLARLRTRAQGQLRRQLVEVTTSLERLASADESEAEREERLLRRLARSTAETAK
jgi:hypothetical protein